MQIGHIKYLHYLIIFSFVKRLDNKPFTSRHKYVKEDLPKL